MLSGEHLPTAAAAPTSTSTEGEVTRLLDEWRTGTLGAGDRLIPLVYRDLRRLAARCMAGERSDHTLEPTALVHEAYLRLAATSQPSWRDRRHFFAVASRMMRRILVDHARSRQTGKRGGGAVRVPLGSATTPVSGGDEEQLAGLLALDEALRSLAGLDARKARVVELRYFGGLTVEETAKVLGVSAPTVALDSRMARAWLLAQIRGAKAEAEGPQSPSAEGGPAG